MGMGSTYVVGMFLLFTLYCIFLCWTLKCSNLSAFVKISPYKAKAKYSKYSTSKSTIKTRDPVLHSSQIHYTSVSVLWRRCRPNIPSLPVAVARGFLCDICFCDKGNWLSVMPCCMLLPLCMWPGESCCDRGLGGVGVEGIWCQLILFWEVMLRVFNRGGFFVEVEKAIPRLSGTLEGTRVAFMSDTKRVCW